MIRKLRPAAVLCLLLAVGAAAPTAPEIKRYPGDATVAELVARLLERLHYAHRPIDEAVSRQFLRNYLDVFDYNHLILDRSDVSEFESKYAESLGQKAKDGDVDPAYEIYARVLERLERRAALVKRLTASTFTFTADESMRADRHEQPWPADEREARELWRKRVKHEILLELLARQKAAEAKAGADKASVSVSSQAAAASAAAPEPSLEQTINARYDRLLRSYRDYDGADILSAYLSALGHVFDPHTDYLAASQKENFDIGMKLSLVGIGAVLGPDEGYAKVLSLVPGGPAATSKRFKPGDRIEAVAQGESPFVETVGMKLDRVVELIRGEKGTRVRLRILPAGALDPSRREIIALTRDEIKLTDLEAKARLYILPGKKPCRIGLLDVPSFYADLRGGDGAKSVTRDVERLLRELERRNVDAVLVDLRHNGGGSLSEALTLTGLFIPRGPVVQVKDARGTIRVLTDEDGGAIYHGPLAVLTSRASASAAEIFAAAMQDYGRSVIIGDKSTYGKGTVQSVVDLEQYLPPAYRMLKPGALKLTVQKFYRVSGGSTQNRGVIPDIHLPSAGDLSDAVESEEKNALPYDEIAPAAYARAGDADGKLAAIEKASGKRVAASREFRWIREDMARWEKRKKDKLVTLNEARLLAERKSDESRETERRKERLAAGEKPLPFEEITLARLDGKAPPSPISTAPARGMFPPEEEERPDVPDAELEESLRIAADLAAAKERTGAVAVRR